ncbi:MAG TPA: PAS domain-containing protein [Campylobacterales bacterium]|nr:PAS domain-containing protein [Campylobacterales bacterium]
MSQATPTGKEIFFPEGEFIVSKTDLKGRIVYGNELFIKMSGYTEEELLGAPHSILRHPDMPKAVFKLLWDTISKGEEIFAFVNNLSKSGANYWVEAQVTPSYDDKGNIIAYHSVRRKPKKESIELVSKVYAEMLRIEKSSGVDASFKYLINILESKGVSYDEFIFSL